MPKGVYNRNRKSKDVQSKPATSKKIVQIQVGQWTMIDDESTAQVTGFSVIGLGNDGVVYQYKKSGVNAWVPFNHRFLTEV